MHFTKHILCWKLFCEIILLDFVSFKDHYRISRNSLNAECHLQILQEIDDFTQMQAKEWDPVLDWFNSRFEVDLKPCSGILGVELPLPTREAIRRYLLSYDIWAAIGRVYYLGYSQL